MRIVVMGLVGYFLMVGACSSDPTAATPQATTGDGSAGDSTDSGGAMGGQGNSGAGASSLDAAPATGGTGGTGGASETGGAGGIEAASDASHDASLPLVDGAIDAAVDDIPDADAAASDGPDAMCEPLRYPAAIPSTALLVLLDRTSTMADSSKWSSTSQAIVDAFDLDAADGASLGLYAAPSGLLAGPACVLSTSVPCQYPAFPQVALDLAGDAKALDAFGVRSSVRNWLIGNQPLAAPGPMPLYGAITAALDALDAWTGSRRMLVVVTDGDIGCGMFTALPGYTDCNGCATEWTNPDDLIQTIANAQQDPTNPVETFVIGLPGADTYDATACNHPPYRMRLALSAMAYAGAPTRVPVDCTGQTYTQGGAEPATPCHIDLSASFSAEILTDTLVEIEHKTLDCVYERPLVDGGFPTSDVNVHYQSADAGEITVPKRTNVGDDCASDGCWDYDADGRITLIGAACDDVRSPASPQVTIALGCPSLAK